MAQLLASLRFSSQAVKMPWRAASTHRSSTSQAISRRWFSNCRLGWERDGATMSITLWSCSQGQSILVTLLPLLIKKQGSPQTQSLGTSQTRLSQVLISDCKECLKHLLVSNHPSQRHRPLLPSCRTVEIKILVLMLLLRMSNLVCAYSAKRTTP